MRGSIRCHRAILRERQAFVIPMPEWTARHVRGIDRVRTVPANSWHSQREAGRVDAWAFGSLRGTEMAAAWGDSVVLIVRRPEPVRSFQVPSASRRVSN